MMPRINEIFRSNAMQEEAGTESGFADLRQQQSRTSAAVWFVKVFSGAYRKRRIRNV